MHRISPSGLPAPLFRPAMLLLLALALLAGCGGGRSGGTTTTPAEAARGPLQTSRSTVVDPAECLRAVSGARSMLAYRVVEGECRRSFTGFDAQLAAGQARRQATAAAATPRIPTPTELFDWAETAYPGYFPTHESNRQFANYTYRFYPGSLNHAAVEGQRVYVQGPLSDGALWDVGALSDFACVVFPNSCGIVPKACAPITSWAVGGQTCVPNPGAGDTASGATVTFTDSIGQPQGSATYRCSDGTLTATQPATCEVPPPLACNTGGLSWIVGGKVCTPNTGEPAQIASGTSHTFHASAVNIGAATYACSNGVLTSTDAATCAPPVGGACTPTTKTWSANGNTCVSDSVLEYIEGGGIFTFFDNTGLPTGYATYTCFQGQLVATGDEACNPMERIQDSFGGDGGPGDGSASGDGTAGDGKPIVGGRVRVVDAVGKVAIATTNSLGYFRVNLTEFIPPMVVSVTRPDGVVRRSLVTRPPITNKYIFIAVTGLTDKIASDVARASGGNGAAQLTPAMIAAKPTAVDNAVNAIRTDPALRALIVDAGLTPSSFDPLGTPFRANGTGYDKVLDNIVVTTDSTGATVVQTVVCAVPASWTVANDTCTPDRGEPSAIANGASVTVRDTLAPTTGSASYSCSQGKVQMVGKPVCQSNGSASGSMR